MKTAIIALCAALSLSLYLIFRCPSAPCVGTVWRQYPFDPFDRHAYIVTQVTNGWVCCYCALDGAETHLTIRAFDSAMRPFSKQ